MELNYIKHYTPSLIEKEIKEHEEQNNLKNIILYNIIRYDNIDFDNIDSNNMKDFIEKNNLDLDLTYFKEYSILLYNLYKAYTTFCESTKMSYTPDKIKSFPKIMQHLYDISNTTLQD